MARGTVNLIELHIEKVVLGCAGLALLTMVILYLIGTPNSVPYDGKDVGAGELDAAILADAQRLRDAVHRGKPAAVDVPDFSGDLDRQVKEGIFGGAGAAPAIAPDLRLAADFGEPIPTLTDDEEASHNVALVTPLRPSQPKLRTGRVLAVRKAPILAATMAPAGAEEQPEEQPEESDEPVELAYVSVAGYFSRDAQQDAMIAAKYAPYRSKAYIVGADVQRQEVLANGEFSAWRDVKDSRATPHLEIPAPQFNPDTGEIENDEDIKAAYTLAKASQAAIMQPEFYEVHAGDFWEIPPLAGFEEEEEEEEVKVAVKPKEKREPTRRQPRRPPPRRTGGTVGTGGAVGVAGTGGGGGRISRGRDTGAARERQQKKEAQKRLREELKEANDALKRKEFDRAEQMAKRIVDHEHASRGDRTKAQGIINRIEKYRRQQARQAGVRPGTPGGTPGGVSVAGPGAGISVAGPGGGVSVAGPGGGPAAPRGRPRLGGREENVTLVTNPDNKEQVAVWFHDDTVEAGKTYRYRMRVKLWNRYVGKMAALKDPEQAKQSVLVGEWSLSSDSITVTPSTYFFAGGPTTSKDGARVEVWKWRKGDWIRETFNVSVGDVIGDVQRVKTGEFDEDLKDIKADVDFTTGAIVLDLRFDEPVTLRQAAGKKGQFNLRDRESMVLVYLDPADGQVKRRVADLDRYDPMYKKLKDLEF